MELSIVTPITLNYFNIYQSKLFYLFGFISVLPTIIYLAITEKREDGMGMGFVDYYLTKLIRRLR